MSKAALAALVRSHLPPREIALLTAKYGRSTGYEKYAHDPCGFARDVLGLELWSKQREILNALVSKTRPRVTVRACHHVGKTVISAAAALWFLYCNRPAKVICTSVKQEQLKKSLFGTIRKLHKAAGLPGARNILDITLSEDEFIFGQVANSDTAFQSHHQEHMLIIVDEASGVSPSIFTAINGLLTSEDSRLLLLGNPTETSGNFYDSHHSKSHLYIPIHIGYLDTPFFTGEKISDKIKLISPAMVEEALQEYGSEDHPLFQAKFLGEFPTQSEDSLIKLTWLDTAEEKKPAEPAAKIEMGVDPGWTGTCETVVYLRQGPNILACHAWNGKEIPESAGMVIKLAREYQADVIRVDANGPGAGLYGLLLEADLPVVKVMAGSRSNFPQRFSKLRDEVWDNLATLLRDGRIGNLTDEKTRAQLSSIKRGFTSAGQLKVESKPEMAKRKLPSPDRADALCLAYFHAHPHHAAPLTEFEPDLEWMSGRDW